MLFSHRLWLPSITDVDIGYILESLADFVLPRSCVVCGRRLLLGERDICLGCRSDIPYTYLWNRPPDWLLPLYYYRDNSPYKRLALSVKYMGNSSLGYRLGEELGRHAAGMYMRSSMRVDAVAPVPLHWWRRWRRGYNQAEMICRGFAAGYGSQAGYEPVVLPELLRRRRATRSQTSVPAASKAANVRTAFSRGKEFGILEEMVSAGRVTLVLVDDTCTSGATFMAASRPLSALAGKVDLRYASLAKVAED